MGYGDVHEPGHDEDYTSMQHKLLERLDTHISNGGEELKWTVEKTSIVLIAVSIARLTAELSGQLRYPIEVEGGENADVGLISSLLRIADALEHNKE